MTPSRKCAVCGGTRGAHFGWCSEVGGPGVHPSEQRRRLEAAGLAPQTPATPLPPPAPSQTAPPAVRRERRAPERPAVSLPPAERPAPSICEHCGQAGGRHALNCGMRITQPRPVLTLVPPPEPEPEPEPRREGAWRWTGPDPDWDAMSEFTLDSSAADLLSVCLHGLPREVPYLVRDDVLILEGFDPEAVERVVREPHYVEIRPETREKGYPILGFRLADVRVIMGFRTPRSPAVIAAYWTSMLAGYDPQTYRARTGGGGAKGTGGVPTNAHAVVKRLKMMGASIAGHHPDADLSGQASVTYHGQDLGKITVGRHVPRTTCESDYQRMQRKVHAIDLRESSVKGHRS